MRCFQYFKDTRWKQITTWKCSKQKVNVGAFNISKIQDESKSQPYQSRKMEDWRCFQYFKDTRWKQITTTIRFYFCLARCFQYFKDTRWKQITTRMRWTSSVRMVLSIFQRYKMKANHNLSSIKFFIVSVLSIFQRYKMKANHNWFYFFFIINNGAFNISKIQDESKSQLFIGQYIGIIRCFQYFKDTRWKQITTSNYVYACFVWCFQYFKDTRWKQITT